MIEIKNISVSYRSGDRQIPALSSVNLSMEKGEYLSILGPNGSGKSTLVKAICGFVHLSEGHIEINGLEVIPGEFSEKLFGKIGVVFQEPTGQFLMPSVRKEIESPLQNLGLTYLDQQKVFREAIEWFELENLLDVSPENLSPGQMQVVNLAVAFSIGSEIMILDEPTTFLDLKSRKLFLDLLAKINGTGRTVIHVTQYPDEALFSKKTAVLDSGKLVACGEPDQLLSDEGLLKRCRLSMPREIEFKKQFGFLHSDSQKTDRFLGTLRVKRSARSIPPVKNEIIISVGSLIFSYPASHFCLEIDDLHLYGKQIVGLVGPSGSGKSTLALLIAGIIKPQKGTIKYHPEKMPDLAEYRKKIGLSWQMPDPVLIGPTVEDDLLLAIKNSGVKNIDAGPLLEAVGLAGCESRIVDTLSGGEKRKLSLASVLAAKPEYLILDEPAAFLDPVSQIELRNIIITILSDVKGALIIGHDLMFLSELTERIIGLNEGKIAFDLPAEKFFSCPEYSRGIGLEVDSMISFRNKLAESGVALSSGSLNPKTIKSILTNSIYPR